MSSLKDKLIRDLLDSYTELSESISLFQESKCSCGEEDEDDCDCDEELDEDDIEECNESDESVEVLLDEETGEHYFIQLCEETLQEQRIKIRVTSRGKKIKRIKCPPGRVLKIVNGVKRCVAPTGRQRLVKKLATRKMNRTKKSKGASYKKRSNFRRQRAIKRRRQMGIRSGQ